MPKIEGVLKSKKKLGLKKREFISKWNPVKSISYTASTKSTIEIDNNSSHDFVVQIVEIVCNINQFSERSAMANLDLIRLNSRE